MYYEDSPYEYPTQDFPDCLEEGLTDHPHKAVEDDGSDVVIMGPSPVHYPDNQLGMSPSYFAGMGPLTSPAPTELASWQKEPTSHTSIMSSISVIRVNSILYVIHEPSSPRITLLISHVDFGDLREMRICPAFSSHGLFLTRQHEFAALAVGVTLRHTID